jgi:hypothetical protein
LQKQRLNKEGKLKLGGKFAGLKDEAAWSEFCKELSAKEWVSRRWSSSVVGASTFSQTS